MAQQLVTRIDDELAEAVDELVASGVAVSRSDAVRIGLRTVIEEHRRRTVGQQIVAGYRAQPQSDEEMAGIDAATVRMIHDEPW